MIFQELTSLIIEHWVCLLSSTGCHSLGYGLFSVSCWSLALTSTSDLRCNAVVAEIRSNNPPTWLGRSCCASYCWCKLNNSALCWGLCSWNSFGWPQFHPWIWLLLRLHPWGWLFLWLHPWSWLISCISSTGILFCGWKSSSSRFTASYCSDDLSLMLPLSSFFNPKTTNIILPFHVIVGCVRYLCLKYTVSVLRSFLTRTIQFLYCSVNDIRCQPSAALSPKDFLDSLSRGIGQHISLERAASCHS